MALVRFVAVVRSVAVVRFVAVVRLVADEAQTLLENVPVDAVDGFSSILQPTVVFEPPSPFLLEDDWYSCVQLEH